MTILIRSADYADAAAIAAVHVASWRDSYRGMLPDAVLDGPLLDERLPMWRQVLADGPAGRLVLVATGDEADTGARPILGFVSGGSARRRGRHGRMDGRFDAEVYALYVAGPHRGLRFGCRLLGAMATRLQLFGHDSLVLWTLQANLRARAFYEALGGRRVGAREGWFGGTPLTEIGYGWPRIDMLTDACSDRLALAWGESPT